MAEIRTNELYLDLSGFDQVSFNVDDFKVSKGQPYEKNEKDEKLKVDIGQVGSMWKMTIKAGRHGTSEVADWFKDNVAGGACIANASNDAVPEKLNFAVKGTLDLIINDDTTESKEKTYSIKDVVIAQGHNTVGDNNWWIGGKEFGDAAKIDILSHLIKFKAIEYTVKKTSKLGLTKKRYFVFYTSGNVNRFNITHVESKL